jgi:CDP-glycerol glycerophosphotransferase
MAADFRRYRPPGYRRPAGLRGLRVRLIERNSYRLYALLGPVNAARVRLRGALRQAGRAAKSLPDHMREK